MNNCSVILAACFGVCGLDKVALCYLQTAWK